MLKYTVVALSLAMATPALAHSDSKFIKGPNGGHIVDAGGGKQHWELVTNGGELTLFVTDAVEKPVDTSGGTADAQVLVGGKTHNVQLAPAGANILKGTGSFAAQKGMRVIVKTNKVGGQSFQARMTPMR